MKAKYFPNTSFWDTVRLGCAPYVWKNICDSRLILERGTRWRIRDGYVVQVWKDRWLPIPITFSPFSSCVDPSLLDLKVSDLLLPSGGWTKYLVW